jgi:hypothetical protein
MGLLRWKALAVLLLGVLRGCFNLHVFSRIMGSFREKVAGRIVLQNPRQSGVFLDIAVDQESNCLLNAIQVASRNSRVSLALSLSSRSTPPPHSPTRRLFSVPSQSASYRSAPQERYD